MANPIQKRQGAKLPHWTAEDATYSVTFRLADALPANAADNLSRELELLEREVKRGQVMTLQQQVRLAKLRTERIDQLLNASHGECLLRQPQAAKVVADALMHFHDQRYDLHAWCVMPNHVHAVFTPRDGHELPRILHSWKSFTATAINRLLQRTGSLWQSESYDHLVRDKADFMHHIHYVRENPVKAGLADWPWVWVAADLA